MVSSGKVQKIKDKQVMILRIQQSTISRIGILHIIEQTIKYNNFNLVHAASVATVARCAQI